MKYQSITDEQRHEPEVYTFPRRRFHIASAIALIGVAVIVFATYYFGMKRGEHRVLLSLGKAVVATQNAQVATPHQAAPAPPTNPEPRFIPYHVEPGDTISDLCNDLYNDGRRAVFMAAGNEIKGLKDPNNLNYIVVGQKLYFPPSIVVNGKTLTANNIRKADERRLRREDRRRSARITVPRLTFSTSVEVTDRVPVIPMPDTSILASTARVASDPLPAIEPMVAHSESTEVIQPPQPQHIAAHSSGYRIVIPALRAKTMQISDRTLKKELETCFVLSDGGQDCSFIAWAQRRKRGDIILSVSVREFPQRPFTMVVANRGKPIRISSDDELIADAVPIQGHFPGPSRFKTGLVMAKGMAVRGGIGMLIGGPIGGIAAAFAPPVAGTIFNHFVREGQQ